ncbi:hypothetical protein [Enterobacter hormaechei]|uniref:hypothetical protein n=1 Tax=Enterobacter hormaechei TaxID=158836 RepID=UPI000E2FE9FE|nr:hypothetical protein [Enterobacter hormaechei]
MQSKRADIRIINSETLSDNWYNLKKYTFDLQRSDGDWQRQEREVYDRGNGATILLYIYFYLAEYLPQDRTSAGGGVKAEGEDIDVLEMTLDDALRGIENGQIVDGKTIMLLYHLALKGIL